MVKLPLYGDGVLDRHLLGLLLLAFVLVLMAKVIEFILYRGVYV